MQPVNAVTPWLVTAPRDPNSEYVRLQLTPPATSPVPSPNYPLSPGRPERGAASPRRKRPKLKKYKAYKTSRNKTSSPTSRSPRIAQPSLHAANTTDLTNQLHSPKRKKRRSLAKRPKEFRRKEHAPVSQLSGHQEIATLPSPRGIYDSYNAHTGLATCLRPPSLPLPLTVSPPVYQEFSPPYSFPTISPNLISPPFPTSPTVPPAFIPSPIPAPPFGYPGSLVQAPHFPQEQPCVACLIEGKTRPHRKRGKLKDAPSSPETSDGEDYNQHTLGRDFGRVGKELKAPTHPHFLSADKGIQPRSPEAKIARELWDWSAQRTLNHSSSTTTLTSGSSATDQSIDDRRPKISREVAYLAMGIAAVAVLLFVAFYGVAQSYIGGNVLPGIGHGQDLVTVPALEESYLEVPAKSEFYHDGPWVKNKQNVLAGLQSGSHLLSRTLGANSTAMYGTDE